MRPKRWHAGRASDSGLRHLFGSAGCVLLFMQHMWTIVQHDGPNHLELWLNQVAAPDDQAGSSSSAGGGPADGVVDIPGGTYMLGASGATQNWLSVNPKR